MLRKNRGATPFARNLSTHEVVFHEEKISSKTEVQMSIRLFAIAAATLWFAAPAVADCQQELSNLKQPAVSAETGAVTDNSGMPATKHQEEVLSGKQQKSGTEITGSTTGAVEAISPHQKQVTGQSSGTPTDKIGQLMVEARKMVDAGDEQGCMKKVSELKDLMGIK
ncbi:MAG: hypothetical protein AAAC48_06820 [Phyllobacterium sp.]|uniref:hypothetical protein n=1 Tax=Phyllobacterium sp. TaxID=1871046 RepID=UPI0030F247D8